MFSKRVRRSDFLAVRVLFAFLVLFAQMSTLGLASAKEKEEEKINQGSFGILDIADNTTKNISQFTDTEPLFQGDAEFAVATAFLYGTSEYKEFVREASLNEGMVSAPNVISVVGLPQAAVTFYIDNAENGLSVVTFIIEYRMLNEVGITQKYYVNQLSDDMVHMRIMWNEYEALNVKLTSDQQVIDADGNQMPYEEYMQFLQDNQETVDLGRGWCEWAMAILCGAGGGAACYGVCGIAAVVNVLGGLGCAIACGLIASVGCVAATNSVCG